MNGLQLIKEIQKIKNPSLREIIFCTSAIGNIPQDFLEETKAKTIEKPHVVKPLIDILNAA